MNDDTIKPQGYKIYIYFDNQLNKQSLNYLLDFPEFIFYVFQLVIFNLFWFKGN